MLSDNEPRANTLSVWVTSTEYLGHETLLGVRIVDHDTNNAHSNTVVRVTGAPILQPQEQITIHLPADKLYLFDRHGLSLQI